MAAELRLLRQRVEQIEKGELEIDHTWGYHVAIAMRCVFFSKKVTFLNQSLFCSLFLVRLEGAIFGMTPTNGRKRIKSRKYFTFLCSW